MLIRKITSLSCLVIILSFAQTVLNDESSDPLAKTLTRGGFFLGKENSVNSLKNFQKAKDEQHILKSILEKKRSKSKMGRNLVTGTKMKKHKTKKRSKKKKKVYAKST